MPIKMCSHKSLHLGRVIAQAVSRWFPTAVARVRARVWSSWICGGHSGAGAGFLRVLQFPLPIFITPNSPSSQSPGAGAIGQKWPTCRNSILVNRLFYESRYISILVYF
jgi:hypothetical protein